MAIVIVVIHFSHYLFSDCPKTYSKFSKSTPVTPLVAADFTIIMSRTLKVIDNHVMHDSGA